MDRSPLASSLRSNFPSFGPPFSRMCYSYSDCSNCDKRSICTSECLCDLEEDCPHRYCGDFEKCGFCHGDLCEDCDERCRVCEHPHCENQECGCSNQTLRSLVTMLALNNIMFDILESFIYFAR